MLPKSEFVRHAPCENCGSSDAGAIYTDGHFHCHKCGYRTAGDGTDLNHQPNRMKGNVQLKGEAVRLPKRKLSQKTCQLYKIYYDGSSLRCHYQNDAGEIEGCKVRSEDKQFYVEGACSSLFGQHLFPSSGKRVVITEGELDAASCYEAMPGWPMVSIPNGVQSAKAAIQRNLQFLQGYEEIVIFFDNDDAGIKGAKEAAQVLPPGKVKIATLQQYKDASDALQVDDSQAIRLAIWNAVEYRPDGIVEGKTLFDSIITPNPPSDYDYPYEGLERKLHGIRLGELVTITAGSGIGKSSFCRELACSLLSSGERVGYLALEESNRRTALGLMSSKVGKPLHIGIHDREELEDAYNQSIKDWNLYLFDGFGSFDPSVVYNRIEYLASGLDCRVVFLDHLSILLSGLDGDERRMIDTTMTKLRSLVERTGIALFLVSHLRRSTDDKGHEEGARVTLGQLRGSAAIAQLSDSVIALERNQQAETNTTTVRVLKNRYSGEVGVACQLHYDLNTCRFHETETAIESDPEF